MNIPKPEGKDDAIPQLSLSYDISDKATREEWDNESIMRVLEEIPHIKPLCHRLLRK